MWVFEESSFVPCAKIKNGKTYSIITDHLGTPTQMYNDEGESVWEQELDMYGKVRKFANKDYVHLPFRYQGQYYDSEIDLCYNRFRYYDPETGRYISEDPIGFASGEFNFYNYVSDSNSWVDIFGLAKTYAQKKAWNNARKKYWKDEAKANPQKYSAHNLDRMKEGKAPQIEVTVRNKATGNIDTKIASMELHHKDPQRNGGSNNASNLDALNPWEHDDIDPYRHTGSDLLKINSDVGSFGD